MHGRREYLSHGAHYLQRVAQTLSIPYTPVSKLTHPIPAVTATPRGAVYWFIP